MSREPGVSDALERAYDAGQSLIVRRIDLLVAECKLLARTIGLVALGAAVALIGWTFLVHGVIEGLAQRYPRFALQLAMGFAHIGLAALLLLRIRSSTDE